MRTAIKQREIDCATSQSGERSSQISSKMQKCQHSQTPLMTQIRNVLRKWHPESIVFTLTSQKTEIAKAASEPRLQRHLCRKRTGEAVHRAEKIGDFDDSRSQSSQSELWISKQSPIRSRGIRFGKSMDSILSMKNEDFSGDGKGCTKVPRTVGQAESHLQRQFIGVWQILWRVILESLYFNTLSIRNQRNSCKSGTPNKRRDVCCIVAIRLGSKIGGLILWNATVICEMSKTSWQLGKHLMNGGLENHLQALWSLLVQWLSIILFLRRSSQGSTNLVRKFYLGIFLGDALFAGGIWKGPVLVADIEKLGSEDASEIHARRLNAKEVSNA